MRDIRRYIASLFLVPCFAAMLWAFPFADDCEVYGSLKIDGSPAVAGVELVAVIGTDEVARTTVTQAGSYSLIVHPFDPQKPDSKGYKSQEDIITVYADGRKAEPSFNAEPGKKKVDLVVKTTLEVKQTTWGKIKALFK
jgi:hypothetical protein